MRTRTLFVGLSVLALGLAAPAAHAGPLAKKPPPTAAEKKAIEEKKNQARDLANKGYDFYTEGKYEQAIEAFEKAEQIYHAPTIVWSLAAAYLKAGKLIEGRAVYQHLVSEDMNARAPEEFRGAKETAKDALAAVEPRIPTFQVRVRGAAGRPLTLKIDGTVSPAELDKPVAINPGTHRFEVVPSTGPSAEKTVDIKERAHEIIAIDVTPPATQPPAPKRPSLAPALIAFGVGAVGLGVGTATGVSTLNQASAIKKTCIGGVHCPASQEGAASSAKALGTVSTIAFAVAGAGAVAGVTLLVIRAKAKPKPSTTGTTVNLVLGPGTLGATGAF